MRGFERVVIVIGIGLSIGVLALSIVARSPALGSVGILLGSLCYLALRSSER